MSDFYRTIVPPIKCQGIKTRLVSWIRSVAPSSFTGRWVEPFMGSGVVAFNICPGKAILADSNPHVINFYKAIAAEKITPISVRSFLVREGDKLLRSNGDHYYVVRERFNQYGDPFDFLFLNRSCFNGLMRFNKKGGFNVPFCRKPHRFAPAYITKICNQVKNISNIINLGKYEFYCQDFSTTINNINEEDMIYCDPPYIARHSDYFNNWDENNERKLANILSLISCKFILSTWYGNKYRKNPFIDALWSEFYMLKQDHFYHVGASEENRNSMTEALITNFEPLLYDAPSEMVEQMILLEPGTSYTPNSSI